MPDATTTLVSKTATPTSKLADSTSQMATKTTAKIAAVTASSKKAVTTATQTGTTGIPEALLQTTIILPSITELFTPPASCFTNVYDGPIITAVNWIMFPIWETDCYPPGIVPSNAASVSPGVCPFGYNEVENTVFVAPPVTKTLATCCPGFVYRSVIKILLTGT
jgi:hypothetical protein